jgi:Protein of unknown function, DUF488
LKENFSAASEFKEENCQGGKLADRLTIGHSTRTIEEFINLLLVHGVSRVADVRTIPRSRHNSQFNSDFLLHDR